MKLAVKPLPARIFNSVLYGWGREPLTPHAAAGIALVIEHHPVPNHFTHVPFCLQARLQWDAASSLCRRQSLQFCSCPLPCSRLSW